MRTIEVHSPSTWREARVVVRALAHIALWSTAIAFAHGHHGTGVAIAGSRGLAVDEVEFAKLASADQRVFRACEAALGVAEDARMSAGQWPSVDQLAARGIAPFVDPLDRAGYRWTMLHDGLAVNYVGVAPAASQRPSFLISAVEPDPAAAKDPNAKIDETHHRFIGGTMLHVSIWIGGTPPSAAAATPSFEDGWRRVTKDRAK